MSGDAFENTHKGVDLDKEAKIVGDLVVDALLYLHLMNGQDEDKASQIVSREFLVFRRARDAVVPVKEIDMRKESHILANLISTALIKSDMLADSAQPRALEIIEEEVLVRRSMESLHK